jgi:hypothetical protein
MEAQALAAGGSSAECQLFANWHRVNGRVDSGFQQLGWTMQNEWRIERGESICVLATWSIRRVAPPRWTLRGSFTPI